MKHTQLVFGMSLSNTKPGKSQSKYEYINPNDIDKLSNLYNISHEWRKTLSSLYPCLLSIDNLSFNSIEHYIQYRKIKLADDEKSYLFTRESGSHIGLGNGYMARNNRKMVILTNVQLHQWDSIISDVKSIAKNAKFSIKLFHDILLATQDAELWSIAPRCKPIRMYNCEILRSKLQMVEV